MNENIKIAFCFDNNLMYQACITIASLVKAGIKDHCHYDIYCICSNGAEKIKDKLDGIISRIDSSSNIYFIKAKNEYANGYEIRNITAGTYLRLQLHKLLPHIDKIIYADIDVLFQKELKGLWNIDISNEYIAGVLACGINQKTQWEFLEKEHEYFKNRLQRGKYVQAGIVVMNLKKIREDKLDEKWRNMVTEPYYYVDQDILNITCLNNIKIIPIKYNMSPTYTKQKSEYLIKEGLYSKQVVKEGLKVPVIIHYAGEKPWNNPNIKRGRLWLNFVNSDKELKEIWETNINRKSIKMKRWIEITTNIGCPNNCIYCPQSTLIKNYKNLDNNIINMTLDSFKKALSNIPKDIQICFAGYSEPFANKNGYDMCKYANDNDYQIFIYTTLFGLTLEQIKSFETWNNIQTMTIHLPDKDNMIKIKIDDNYLEKLKLIASLNINNIRFSVIGTLHPQLKNILKNVKIEEFRLNLRGGNVDKNKIPAGVIYEEFEPVSIDKQKPIICKRRLSNLSTKQRPTQLENSVLLPNGDLTLCCMDYGLQHIIGNIYKNQYKDIFNSKDFKTIEESMLAKNQNDLLCRNCEWAIEFNEKRWKNFKKTGKYEIPTPLIQQIFSIKNQTHKFKKYKVITLAGVKIKIHKKSKLEKLLARKYDPKLSLEDKKYIIEHQFERAVGYKPNIDNPKSFNEKMQWLKLYNEDPLLTKCADKYLVREYVKEKIGEEYLIPLLGVWDSPDEIDFDKLPNQFVLKVNWGSGQNIIVKDKSKLDIKEAKAKLKEWLKPHSNHYYLGFEWCYKNIQAKIIAEKYIQQLNDDLYDYKFLSYNGKVKNLFVVSDRYNNKYVDFYDTDWNKLPFERLYHNSPNGIAKPQNLDKMISLAERLSKDFPFVRVDFYDIEDKIYFGEITFYPGNGLEAFEPVEWDYKLGELLTLPVSQNGGGGQDSVPDKIQGK